MSTSTCPLLGPHRPALQDPKWSRSSRAEDGCSGRLRAHADPRPGHVGSSPPETGSQGSSAEFLKPERHRPGGTCAQTGSECQRWEGASRPGGPTHCHFANTMTREGDGLAEHSSKLVAELGPESMAPDLRAPNSFPASNTIHWHHTDPTSSSAQIFQPLVGGSSRPPCLSWVIQELSLQADGPLS